MYVRACWEEGVSTQPDVPFFAESVFSMSNVSNNTGNVCGIPPYNAYLSLSCSPSPSPPTPTLSVKSASQTASWGTSTSAHQLQLVGRFQWRSQKFFHRGCVTPIVSNLQPTSFTVSGLSQLLCSVYWCLYKLPIFIGYTN